jgi:hypothetical protein
MKKKAISKKETTEKIMTKPRQKKAVLRRTEDSPTLPKKKAIPKKETYVCVRTCYFTRKGHGSADLYRMGDTVEKDPEETLPRHFLPGSDVFEALKHNDYDPTPPG